MLELGYDYASCVRGSEKVAWRVDDIMPPDTRLDFSRPFLPAALSGRGEPGFLTQAESRQLNQITGNSYLNLFAFVEEYILATMVEHAHAEVFGDHHAIRALTRFADEEGKHQQLFYRYLDAFRRDFGHECEVLGSAAVVAGVVMSKSPIAVMMLTYHIEIMTQAHYVECVKDDHGIDPLFAKLLHAHWLEESQHARIDALELDKLLRDASREQIEQGFTDYLDLIGAVDGLLAQQSAMDVRSLARASGRGFSDAEAAQLVASQHAGYRYTFLVYGMKNPSHIAAMTRMWPEGAATVAARAAELS